MVQEAGQAWDVENWVLKREIGAHRACEDAGRGGFSLSDPPSSGTGRKEGYKHHPCSLLTPTTAGFLQLPTKNFLLRVARYFIIMQSSEMTIQRKTQPLHIFIGFFTIIFS